MEASVTLPHLDLSTVKGMSAMAAGSAKYQTVRKYKGNARLHYQLGSNKLEYQWQKIFLLFWTKLYSLRCATLRYMHCALLSPTRKKFIIQSNNLSRKKKDLKGLIFLAILPVSEREKKAIR